MVGWINIASHRSSRRRVATDAACQVIDTLEKVNCAESVFRVGY